MEEFFCYTIKRKAVWEQVKPTLEMVFIMF